MGTLGGFAPPFGTHLPPHPLASPSDFGPAPSPPHPLATLAPLRSASPNPGILRAWFALAHKPRSPLAPPSKAGLRSPRKGDVERKMYAAADHPTLGLKDVREQGSPWHLSGKARTVAWASSPHAPGRAVGTRHLPQPGGEIMTQDLFIGIDISKAKLDVAVSPGEHSWSVSNTEEGIKNSLRRFANSALPRSS